MKKFICALVFLLSIFVVSCAAVESGVPGTDSSDTAGDSTAANESDGNVLFSYPTGSSSAAEPSSESFTSEQPSADSASVAESAASEDSGSVGEMSVDSSTAPEPVSSAAPEPESSAATEPVSSAEPVPESSAATESTAPESSAAAESTTPSTVPEDMSSPDISATVSPYGEVWVNDLRDQQDRDYHGFSAEELDHYFDDALLVGDSVCNGLKLYMSNYEKIFNGMTFSTGACYGFHNALSAVSDKSMHPLYQGVKRTIWDMVALTNPNKLFIGFGLNDFGCTTAESNKNCLEKIIANVRAVKPDIQIIILSAEYFTKDGESYHPELNDYRTNARHRDYNQYLLDYCNAMGLDYIDVSNCIADDYGYLPKDASLDNYCHMKIEYYSLWRDIFYSYAANKKLGTYKNPARMK